MDRRTCRKLAYFLFTSYALVSNEPIPVISGALDLALATLWEHAEIPDWARRELHFAENKVRLVCAESPELISVASQAYLLRFDSTYRRVTPSDCRWLHNFCLQRIGMSRSEARRYGEALVRRLEQAKATLAAYAV